MIKEDTPEISILDKNCHPVLSQAKLYQKKDWSMCLTQNNYQTLGR
jgi:hypothetical protein